MCFARGSILTAAHAFRGGGAPKSPYTCSKARRQDIPSARYPWITFGIEAHVQYKRRSAASTVQGVGVLSGRVPARGRFLSVLKSGPSSRRHTHFVAAALSKVPIHALKLGDRTIIARVPRDLLTGFKARAQYKHHSAAGTVQRVGVARAFSRQRTFFFQSRKVPHRHGGSRISWRRHSQKSLYAPSS